MTAAHSLCLSKRQHATAPPASARKQSTAPATKDISCITIVQAYARGNALACWTLGFHVTPRHLAARESTMPAFLQQTCYTKLVSPQGQTENHSRLGCIRQVAGIIQGQLGLK
eukprot:GHRQ01019197.1.p2 GENE.GHRQ01019197.1~~GHRQ01019197.1.p2  ORF type:complete len:113 (-),score=7.06 GHRQ01019197.1:589-927(-)